MGKNINAYFERDYIKSLDEGLKKELRFIKENYEPISNEQVDWLVNQGLVKRTRKFKNKRCMWVHPDNGQILYLDLYYKRINFCGFFINK